MIQVRGVSEASHVAVHAAQQVVYTVSRLPGGEALALTCHGSFVVGVRDGLMRHVWRQH